MIGRQHLLQAFERRNRTARTNLGRQAEGAAEFRVGEPIRRRHVVVGPAHFDAARPAHRARRLGRARERRPRPFQLALDLEVAPLDRGDRRLVAAIEPHEDTWMVSQPQQLIAQRRRAHLVILLGPLVPQLPLIAAAPAGHDENALAIREIVERVVFELALGTNGVQPHFLDVPEFGFEPFGRLRPQQHVGGPPAAANEDWFSVDAEKTMAFIGQLRAELVDAEADLASIRLLTIHFDGD